MFAEFVGSIISARMRTVLITIRRKLLVTLTNLQNAIHRLFYYLNLLFEFLSNLLVGYYEIHGE